MMNKELLFSLTKKDFEFKFVKGHSSGGQKVNKTNSCVQCFHRPSGAMGESFDTRSQHKNKEIAFKRMAESKKFQDWLQIEIMRYTGKLQEVEDKVDSMMNRENDFRVEVFKDGKWEEE